MVNRPSTLVVSKQSGQNTVAVADAVKERLAELTPGLPRDVKNTNRRRPDDLYQSCAALDKSAPD